MRALEAQRSYVGKIPVRNLWLLALYAFDLARFSGSFDAEVEASPDIPDLLGKLLCNAVELRLRRNLSFGYRHRSAVLSRVRGRIDVLGTYSHQFLRQGRVACQFDDLTIDTPRNRFVRGALDAIAPRVTSSELSHRCRTLASDLAFLGVSGVVPTRSEISQDRFGRHDAGDRFMVAVSRMIYDVVLPTEAAGAVNLTSLERDERVVRKLFERAVGNFLALELRNHEGWTVLSGKRFRWQTSYETAGIRSILPHMITDVILENKAAGKRIVIDTKFTGIFSSSQYRERVLKSNYLYQMYAYLQSQSGCGNPLSDRSTGVLLHPAIDCEVDEAVCIQGHQIRFVTVDLMLPANAVLERLRSLIPV